MDNIVIKTAQGEQLNINVVRYFRLNGIEYLVFSLNEVDEGGYVKLYISKVNGEVANTITDDVEWNLIKDTVKTIIKSNKENLPLTITDLDVRKLSEVQIIDQKVFKLSETFIQLLGANKKIESYIETTPITNNEGTPVMESTDALDEFSLNSIQPNPILDSFSPTEQPIIPEPVLPQGEEEPVGAIEQLAVNNIATLPDVENHAGEQGVVSELQPYNTNLENISSNEQDYRILYENELNKNELLIAENEKYKAIINNLRSIINELETF